MNTSGVPHLKTDTIRRIDYREASLYARKWMNRLLLQLASNEDIGASSAVEKDSKTNRQGQKQVIEAIENLLMTFVAKEEAVAQYNRNTAKTNEAIYKRYTQLVLELLSGFGSMDAEYLKTMEWLSPILLSSCIRSTNEDVRLLVQKIVDKTSPVSQSQKSEQKREPLSTEEVATKVAEKEVSVSEEIENGDAPVVESNGAIHC